MGLFSRGTRGTRDLSLDSDTDLLTRPELEDDEGGHDRYAHYIKKEKVVESAVTGKAVRALCGKKWVPSHDPEKYPICPACKAIFEAMPDKSSNKKESE
jgi:hypothetical protein